MPAFSRVLEPRPSAAMANEAVTTDPSESIAVTRFESRTNFSTRIGAKNIMFGSFSNALNAAHRICRFSARYPSGPTPTSS